jgi:hypothetical protein
LPETFVKPEIKIPRAFVMWTLFKDSVENGERGFSMLPKPEAQV